MQFSTQSTADGSRVVIKQLSSTEHTAAAEELPEHSKLLPRGNPAL